MKEDFQKQFSEKEAVVLFNFGAPENQGHILNYRIRLFSDPEILSFIKGDFFRKMIAFFISIVSVTKAKKKYRRIGGISPLNEISEKQRASLEKELNSSSNVKYKVYLSMLYSGPKINETLSEISREKIKKVTFVPLFPHFSKVTTGSYYKKLESIIGKFDFEYKLIDSYFDDPIFIDAWKNKILRKFNSGGDDTAIVFSAHGIPQRHIDEGDPYKLQIEKSVKKIYQKLNTRVPYFITFQSRSGFRKWLKPSTVEIIKKLAKMKKNVVFVPISFVADNFETIYEADIELAGIYKKTGGNKFLRIDSLNEDIIFNKCLAKLIRND